jgi:hypothetical protein
VKVGLPKDNRAGGLQSPNYLRIFGRNSVFEQLARRSSPNASSVDIVFQRDRDTVQWTAPPSALHLRFELARVGEGCLGGHRYVSVEPRIELLDTLEAAFCQLDWRDGFLPHAVRGCG